MKSRKLLLGCGVVLALVLGVVVIGIVVSYLIPSVDQQLLPGTFSISVNINQPLNGTALPLNQPVSVYVQAWGDQPLQDIQLLVGGVPQPNGSSSPAGDNKMMSIWAFTPDKEGVYTLLARVNTRNGQTGISNAVIVNVLPADQIPPPLIQSGAAMPQVINDETNGAAPEGGVSIPPPFTDQGGAGNPPPFPTEPPSQEPPAEPSQQPGDNLIPIKYLLWAELLTNNIFEVNPPVAPELDGGSNQCDGILVVQDNSTDEVGFFLYRLDPGQQAFSRIATLDGKAGKAAFSYHDPGLASGLYLYYLSAFNSAGESASNTISITVNAPQCAVANKPKFDAESIPIDLGQPADKAYCYGSASGMPWVRLPYGQNNFIYPVNNKIDLAPFWNLIPLPQPTPPQVVLNMECWGWSGGTLIYLGASSQTFSGGNPGPTPPPGSDGTLGEPPNYKIANPYNLHISNDPNECQDHAPNIPGAVQQCKDYMASFGNSFLFWDYNRYGDCNPGAEICDLSFQPADDFHIYRIKSGVVSYFVGSGLNYHYETGTHDGLDTALYFVRAHSNTYGESGNSNSVFFVYQGKVLETTIDPTSFEITSKEVYGDDPTPPQWYSYSPNGGALFSGYAFMPFNGNYRDVWAESTVTFNLPEDMSILGARLNWKNKSYTTSGPGANNVIKNCQVFLITGPGGWPLAPSVPAGSENYNVLDAVSNAELKGQQSIDFSFIGPRTLKPTVRPDACLWYINNLSLTLSYH